MVWLSIPTAGKLDPHWDGKWSVKSVKTPLTLEITDGVKTKVVHVNRLCQRIVPSSTNKEEPSGRVLQDSHPNWEAPPVDHVKMPPSKVPLPVHHEHQDVVQDLLFNLSISNWLIKKMLQLTNSIITEERRYPERIRCPPERY